MLNLPLEKPDSAHPQRQRAEAKAQYIMHVIWGCYFAAAALSLVFQIYIRLQECAGTRACAISLGKAVFWSLAWPFYWLYYFNV